MWRCFRERDQLAAPFKGFGLILCHWSQTCLEPPIIDVPWTMDHRRGLNRGRRGSKHWEARGTPGRALNSPRSFCWCPKSLSWNKTASTIWSRPCSIKMFLCEIWPEVMQLLVILKSRLDSVDRLTDRQVKPQWVTAQENYLWSFSLAHKMCSPCRASVKVLQVHTVSAAPYLVWSSSNSFETRMMY